jgi:hypothetical protein
MDDEQTDSKTESEQDTDRARRAALRTLGKAAYVAPAVIATLAATKAMAASFEEGPS